MSKATSVPDGYTETSRAALDAQSSVTDAFMNKLWPTQTDGKLYSSDNFRAFQRPDGSGRIRHYRTTETFRTRNDTILVNTECHSAGFAHCSPPSSRSYDINRVPIPFIEQLHDGRLRDIIDVRASSAGSVVVFDGSEEAVFFGSDSTHKDRTWFGFTFSLTEATTPEEAVDLLTPDEARDRDYIRQGEWFLFEDSPPENLPIKKCLPKADRKQDWEIPRAADLSVKKTLDYLPKTCPSCDGTGLEIHERAPVVVCPSCNHKFAYGEYDPEIVLPKPLTERYTDAERQLGSHVPRDLKVSPEGETFVRGTFRHTDNEHYMENLGEIWHRAVTHDRDVQTYSRNQRGRRYD